MLKRTQSLFLVLGLFLLAPTPLSLCATLADLPGECVQPFAQPDCEQMEMAQHPLALRASNDLSCCQVGQAPLPEATAKIAAPLASFDTLRSDRLVAPQQPDRLAHFEVSPVVSPPDRQQLLCVFLI